MLLIYWFANPKIFPRSRWAYLSLHDWSRGRLSDYGSRIASRIKITYCPRKTEIIWPRPVEVGGGKERRIHSYFWGRLKLNLYYYNCQFFGLLIVVRTTEPYDQSWARLEWSFGDVVRCRWVFIAMSNHWKDGIHAKLKEVVWSYLNGVVALEFNFFPLSLVAFLAPPLAKTRPGYFTITNTNSWFIYIFSLYDQSCIFFPLSDVILLAARLQCWLPEN